MPPHDDCRNERGTQLETYDWEQANGEVHQATDSDEGEDVKVGHFQP